MAYALDLAKRMKDYLGDLPDLEEKKMFGGVGFLVRGNMACGVHGDEMIVRVGADNYSAALQKPFTRPFDMTGRAMAGWVMVARQGFEQERDFEEWVQKGVDFARTLPPK